MRMLSSVCINDLLLAPTYPTWPMCMIDADLSKLNLLPLRDRARVTARYSPVQNIDNNIRMVMVNLM